MTPINKPYDCSIPKTNGKQPRSSVRWATMEDCVWWKEEVRRVKSTLPKKLHEIAHADLDLGATAINHYKTVRPKKRPSA